MHCMHNTYDIHTYLFVDTFDEMTDWIFINKNTRCASYCSSYVRRNQTEFQCQIESITLTVGFSIDRCIIALKNGDFV